jgi:hypothetical protein
MNYESFLKIVYAEEQKKQSIIKRIINFFTNLIKS